MSLSRRTAAATAAAALVVALLTSAGFAAVVQRDQRAALDARARALAIGAVPLVDALSLSDASAERVALQSWLQAAIDADGGGALAWIVVADGAGKALAGAVNADVVGAPLGADPVAAVLLQAVTPAHLREWHTTVIGHDSKSGTESKTGSIRVALSTTPSQRALLSTVAAFTVLALLSAVAAALVVFWRLNRSVVRPIGRVAQAMIRLKNGEVDAHVDELGESDDEVGALIAGYNDLVTGIKERDALRGRLSQHVGADIVNDATALDRGRVNEVTVVVADVRGFTQLTRKMAPDQIAALLDNLHGSWIGVVESRGGHVESMHGDTLIAVWGALKPRPDDVVQATSAAWEILEAARRLSAQRQMKKEEAFATGVGVASGPAFAGPVGNAARRSFAVVGEVKSIARRAMEEGRAQDLGLLIDETTWHGLAGAFEGKATPPILVRGIGMPLVLWRVRPHGALPALVTPRAPRDTPVPAGKSRDEEPTDKVRASPSGVIDGDTPVVGKGRSKTPVASATANVNPTDNATVNMRPEVRTEKLQRAPSKPSSHEPGGDL